MKFIMYSNFILFLDKILQFGHDSPLTESTTKLYNSNVNGNYIIAMLTELVRLSSNFKAE